MTTYTREELYEMPDDDLSSVYESITQTPLLSTIKKKDMIEQIISLSTSKQSEEEEVKKSRKKPVKKIRSTMYKTKTSPEKNIEVTMKTSTRGRPRKEVVEEQSVLEQIEEELSEEKGTTQKRGRPKKIDVPAKVPSSRRGRPSQKNKEEEEEISSSLNSSSSSIDNITMSSKKLNILNPHASFQKSDTIKESTIPIIVSEKNTISVVLPIQQDAVQTISDFLHMVTVNPIVETEPKTIEDEISDITSRISNLDIVPEKSRNPRRPVKSPKIRLIDEEIDALTKRITKLKLQRKEDNGSSKVNEDNARDDDMSYESMEIVPKKSIEDIILEVVPSKLKKIEDLSPKSNLSSLRSTTRRESSSKRKNETSELTTRIGSMSLDSNPPSRVSSEKKLGGNVDIVSILRNVERDKVSGDRGRKYYSSKEMEIFLRDIGLKSIGKKEELAQRLIDILDRYGL